MMPPGSLEQVVFRMDALHRIAAAGVPVLNPPRAVEAAVDKYLTLALLEAAALPVPPTWAGQGATEALAAFDALGGDVVVKPLFGSEGADWSGSATRSWPGGLFTHSNAWARSSIFSASSGIRATTTASSCCAAR